MSGGDARHYQILERLAEGGMAVVDLAVSKGLDGFERELVLKRILPRFSRDERFARMFVDEARIAARLTHPNIVQIYEFGKIDDQYFLAMEHVPGLDLSRLFRALEARGERLPLGLAVFVIVEVCRALDYAHRKCGADGRPLGIVHRDVSPQNVLISFEGAVKLADFGIASAAERHEKTLDDVVKGKAAYMSPEQLRGEPLDHRTDIYAAAVVLDLLLAWEHPYAQPSDWPTIERALAHDWPPPSRRAPHVPPRLDAIVVRGEASRREDRFATAGEMAEALEAFLFDEHLRATASELAGLMKQLGGQRERRAASGELERIVASELRKLGDGAEPLPHYTAVITPRRTRGRAPPSGATDPLFGVRAAPRTAPEPEPAPPVEPGTAPLAVVPWTREPQRAAPAPSAAAAPPDQLPARRRPALLALAAALATLLAVGAFLMVRGERWSAARPPGSDAAIHAAAPRALDEGAPPPRAPEPAVPAVDADALPRDAGPGPGVEVAMTLRDAPVAAPSNPSTEPAAQGWLRVATRPHWADVYVDGRRLGSTPLVARVAAGRRQVRLVNPHLGRSERHVVSVRPEHTREAPATLSLDEF